ncbi:MAG: Ferrous iron transport protein B [Firmicutes bacterium ADurb.Bin356]|nr:MAG: Ferrous iron transport protein B [Firmicutes bacterium ADurb.Bin356]
MRRTLGELKPGESGYIATVGSEDPRVKRRLVDMGITPMTRIFVRKTAPMGDPIEVHLRGYDLSLRRADAMHITLYEADELEDALNKERSFQHRRRKRAGRLLENHADLSDQVAHERAAELTQWAVSLSQDSVRLPLPGCPMGDGCERGAGAKRTLLNSFNPCASCDRCCPHAGRAKRGRRCKSASPLDNQPVKIALVGNPNSGKTTLFNAITGAHEYVGNWPGVTVEKKEGRIQAHGHEITLIDLPGIYSLSPHSMEEIIARNFVIKEQPDAIINIVDATNLERNLYLSVQLMELERPMIIALNMMDEIKKRGDTIDITRLSLELGIPVVPISARTGEGVQELLNQCELLIELAHEQMHRGFCIEPDDFYDEYTHAVHHKIGEIIGDNAERAGIPSHWAQVKLLEGDALVREALALSEEQQDKLDEIVNTYAGEAPGIDNETRMADTRYRFISQITAAAVRHARKQGEKSPSDRIDAILTHKYFAIPVFLLIMLGIFTLTFSTLGAWLSDQVEIFISTLSSWLSIWLFNIGTSKWLTSLISDGIILGVGGVLTFLPQIALLFLCLSLLEDSGYLSRTAFIMDKLLRRFGLSGKSFIPMLMGFGCTVPATMAARTMENEKDRRMTILLLPFMSCSAKLPVYGLIAGAFFSHNRGLVVFSLYALGIVAGILTGLLFKRTLFTGMDAPFVLEMPPYRRPMLKNTLRHVSLRIQHFLEKAGTVILLMSAVLWFLQSFDASFIMVEDSAKSILGLVGGWLAPAFAPLGFGAWQASVALLAGLVAKEVVVASLSLFYGFSAAAGDSAVRASLSSTFTPLSAYSFLVFVLLYVPCMAAVATMRRELNSVKWTAFMVAYQVGIAYIAALLIYQAGTLLGL